MWFIYAGLGAASLLVAVYLMILAGFWRKVARHPGLAIRYFLSRAEWIVEGGVTPQRTGLSGPFVVRLGDTAFSVFGRQDRRSSQGYFSAFVRDYERAVLAGTVERVPDDPDSLLSWLDESQPAESSRLRRELHLLQATY